jgi:N-acetylneuraminic acid mutarotase
MPVVRPAFERLEERRLLAAFAAEINFQPAAIPVPTGYTADTGGTYASHDNGLIYGWNVDLSHQARFHKTKLAADARYETVVLSRSKTGRRPADAWQIQIPDGDYTVHLVTGDGTASGRSQVELNGAVALDGKSTSKSPWIESTVTVTVTDGVLTLTNGPKAKINRLAYIDIAQVDSSTPINNNSPTSPTPTPTPPSLTPTPTPTPPQPDPWSQPLVWTSLANAPVKVAEAQSITLNGKLYVFGGYDVTTPDYQPTNASSVFDSATNMWKSIAPMPAAETHMGVATDGSYIYVAGGYTFDPVTTYQTFGTTNVFRYDPAHNSWTTYTPLPSPRAAGALVYLDGQLHFFDGVDPTRAGKTDHWTLNVSSASPQWTTSTSLPFSRNHMAGVVLDGKIYAVGGQSTADDSSTTADVLVWDPAHPSSWTAVASMPTPRSHAVVVAIDGRIVVAGGTVANDVPLSSVISYDPATNAWTNLTSLPDARLAPVGGAIGNEILVASGFGDDQLQSKTWAATV